jgi:hypothetical protein
VAVRRMTSGISDDAARRVVMVSSEAAKGSRNGSFARSPVSSALKTLIQVLNYTHPLSIL